MSQSQSHAALGRSLGASAGAAAAGAANGGANGHRADAAGPAAQRGGQGAGSLALATAATATAPAAATAGAIGASRGASEGSELRMGAECGNVTIALQNIVATVNVTVGQKRALDLKKLAHHARFAEYSPKKFAALIMRLRSPKTTALMFESGKIVVTGAKSVAEATSAARKYVKIIKFIMTKAGGSGGGDISVRFQGPTLQNMVGVADCKFPIRLEGLALSHMPHCSYEPELFPGLIYRLHSPKTVVIVFVSGKVVITGAKSPDDIKAAMTAIYPILVNFKKPIRATA